MRILDIARLSLKNLKGIWAAIPALGFAAAAFCLCFAGAVVSTVREEKAQPYEIVVAAAGTQSFSGSDIAAITGIEHVVAATGVLETTATVTAGGYTAALTLTGIDPDYLEGRFSQGGVFPEDTVMPYIVLNPAACRQFSNGGNAPAQGEAPDIDWTSGSAAVQTSEEAKPVTSKICGVLAEDEDAGEEQAPAAYISLSSAKKLLRKSGLSADVKTVWVRVRNIGCAKAVSRAIAALGLTVTNPAEDLQAGWDAKTKEMVYLLVIGAFCLACISLIFAAWREMSFLREKEAFLALRWMGMKDSEIRRMFAVQALMVSVTGAAIGVIAAVSLPSFLTAELKGASIYTLPVPLAAGSVSFAACVLSGVIPACTFRRRAGALLKRSYRP
jgi:hypothetical protein